MLLLLVAATVVAPAANRSYTASRHVLTMDGVDVGVLHSYSGCRAVAEVTRADLGADQTTKKHISGIRYEPCALVIGAGMRPVVYDWIREAFELKATRKTVALSAIDHNLKETARIVLRDAIISGVTLPTLDAASKDPGTIILTLAPEAITAQKGTGASISPAGAADRKSVV